MIGRNLQISIKLSVKKLGKRVACSALIKSDGEVVVASSGVGNIIATRRKVLKTDVSKSLSHVETTMNNSRLILTYPRILRLIRTEISTSSSSGTTNTVIAQILCKIKAMLRIAILVIILSRGLI